MEKRVPLTADMGANLVRTEAFTDENRIFFQSKQDVTPIQEFNHFQRKETAQIFNSGFQRGDHWRHAARIPNIIVDQLMKKGIWQDKKRLKKWLNDSANKAWRCSDAYL